MNSLCSIVRGFGWSIFDGRELLEPPPKPEVEFPTGPYMDACEALDQVAGGKWSEDRVIQAERDARRWSVSVVADLTRLSSNFSFPYSNDFYSVYLHFPDDPRESKASQADDHEAGHLRDIELLKNVLKGQRQFKQLIDHLSQRKRLEVSDDFSLFQAYLELIRRQVPLDQRQSFEKCVSYFFRDPSRFTPDQLNHISY